MKQFSSKFTISFIVACIISCIAYAASIDNLQTIYIKKSDGEKISFQVEIANTDEKRGLGLMNRESLPVDQGMLFLFEKRQVVDMWMKNTLIPLDILFIDKNGMIVKIVKNATPHSIKTISSEISVVAVLEINAMISDKLSININDTVLHSYFENVTK